MTPEPPAHDLGELEALTPAGIAYHSEAAKKVANALPDLIAVVRAAREFLEIEYPDGTEHPADAYADRLATALRPFYGSDKEPS